MKKAVIALTTAVLLAGSASVYAAPPAAAPAAGAPAAGEHGHWRPSPQDRAALFDARIAALKAGLKLNAEQEKFWPQLEQTLRSTAADAAARRAQIRAARSDEVQNDPLARMRLRAQMMASRASDLTKIADAAEPLYKTLDEGQKHRLGILLREHERGHMSGRSDRGGSGEGRRG